MNSNSRTREPDFYKAVEAVLIDAGGDATISYIRRKIPRYLALSAADCAPSSTRPGEQLWEQQVRNIVSHRDCDGNPIKLGRFRYSKRRLSLATSPQRELFENDNNSCDKDRT